MKLFHSHGAQSHLSQKFIILPEILQILVGLSGQVNSNIHAHESFEVNVLAYLQFLNLVRFKLPNAHLIFSSSRLEYGKPVYLPVDEQHPIQPLSLYGIHKHLISDYCQFLFRVHQFPTTVIRTSNPYGPHKFRRNHSYNVINYFVDLALKNKEIKLFGGGRQQRDYLYIDDLVEAFLAIEQNPKSFGKIYNVGSGKGITLNQISTVIVSQAGKGIIKILPWPDEYKQVETGDYISDISKITKEIKWKPKTSLSEGIRNTISFQNLL